MEPPEARTYLVRLTALHSAAILAPAGILLAGLGMPEVGLALFAIGLVCCLGAQTSAYSGAVRSRNGKRWFGAGSVSADAVERTSWRPIDDAARSLGRDARRARRTFMAMAGIAVAVVLVTAAVAIASAFT